MKKYLYFALIVVIIIVVYNLVVAKPRSYKLEYKYNDYNVTEEYIADVGAYIFTLKNESNSFAFGLEHKYTSKRKLISNVNVTEEDNSTCMNIKVFDKAFSTICNEDNTIYDASIKTSREDKEVAKYNNIHIYNKDYNYYIWNGYGLTNILTKKEYNVLKKESYDNNFSASIGNYIMFANYDEGTKYKTLYVFDTKDNKYNTIELENAIDSDSYYMGYVDNAVYFFDRKNSKEFKIDLESEKVNIVSDANGGLIYNGDRKEAIPIEKLKYNDYKFAYNNLYHYSINDKQIYLNYYKNENYILISNNTIKDIIKVDNEQVFYIGEDNKLYTYNDKKKEQTLLEDFEWNFSYNNKIFVFNK